jgi:hypothetical protein
MWNNKNNGDELFEEIFESGQWEALSFQKRREILLEIAKTQIEAPEESLLVGNENCNVPYEMINLAGTRAYKAQGAFGSGASRVLSMNAASAHARAKAAKETAEILLKYFNENTIKELFQEKGDALFGDLD